jgi:hypothetical protein
MFIFMDASTGIDHSARPVAGSTVLSGRPAQTTWRRTTAR